MSVEQYCFHCHAPAQRLVCSACKVAVYCGAKCQRSDWISGEHWLMCQTHGAVLIEGKRDREKENADPNPVDPFTLQPFAEIDARNRIHIEGDNGGYFHLPSLYKWIHHQGYTSNPLTNVNFSDDQIKLVDDAALKRYPLQIERRAMFGPSDAIKTTSLQTFDGIAIEILNKLIVPAMSPTSADLIASTFYELLRALSSRNIFISVKLEDQDLAPETQQEFTDLFKFANGNLYAEIAKLSQHYGDMQVYQWPSRNPILNITAYVGSAANPRLIYRHNMIYANAAASRGLPTGFFTTRANDAAQYL